MTLLPVLYKAAMKLFDSGFGHRPRPFSSTESLALHHDPHHPRAKPTSGAVSL